MPLGEGCDGKAEKKPPVSEFESPKLKIASKAHLPSVFTNSKASAAIKIIMIFLKEAEFFVNERLVLDPTILVAILSGYAIREIYKFWSMEWHICEVLI